MQYIDAKLEWMKIRGNARDLGSKVSWFEVNQYTIRLPPEKRDHVEVGLQIHCIHLFFSITSVCGVGYQYDV